jgi:hypothetical protein
VTERSWKIRTLPLGKGFGACWPANVGGPSFQTIRSVRRSLRLQVGKGDKATLYVNGESLAEKTQPKKVSAVK